MILTKDKLQVSSMLQRTVNTFIKLTFQRLTQISVGFTYTVLTIRQNFPGSAF